MRRWRVYKDSENEGWRWAQWVAIPTRENWGEEPQVHRFSEWHMAMEYATHQAQQSPNIITIKDPSGEFCDLTATVNDRDLIGLKSGGDRFTLARHEWKPLARFLLTEAYRPEEA